MGERIEVIILSFLGVMVVVIFMSLGVDMQRAKTTGSPWRRRLITAGLCLLAALGIHSPMKAKEIPGPPAFCCLTPELVAADNKALLESVEWKKVSQTWKDAYEVASGKKGPYPFSEKEKKELLTSLDEASLKIDDFHTGRLLSDAESALLKGELAYLRSGIESRRPTEMQGATCYMPLPYNYEARNSVERINKRLPLLDKLAACSTITDDVAEKVLSSIEMDIRGLEKNLKGLKEADLTRAEEAIEKAKAGVRKIRARLHPATPSPDTVN